MSDNIDTYGVVAGNVLDLNSGTSRIVGDVGSFNTIMGSGLADISGATNIGTAANAVLTNAGFIYSAYMSYTPNTITTSAIIGGMTFNPGVNALTNPGVTIGGATPQVTLDGNGTYTFQVPNGDLITDPTSGPVFFNFLNGAQASDVYWAVSGNLNLQTVGGNTTSFAGTVLCQGNITMGTSSSAASGLIAFSSSPNGIITLNQNAIVCRDSQIILDNIGDNYINIETTLADNQAIQINAANANGGILISAGFGGIAIDTTNSISINAEDASNFSTTTGNMLLQSQPALVYLDGGAGIDIGCDNDLANTATQIITPIINVGTSASAKTIGIGNTTSTTSVTVNSGSGAITLSANSGQVNIAGNNSMSNAINLDASSGSNGVNIITGSGGCTVNSGTGQIEFVSNSTTVDAIRLDSSASSGGVFIAAGSSGLSLGNDAISHPVVLGNSTGATSVTIQSGSGGITSNSNTGKNIMYSSNTNVDAIRIDSSPSSGGVYIAGGSSGIYVGNNTVAQPIVIGNTTGTTAVIIESGSFGITIGNDTSSGEVQIANGTAAKTVTVGNNLSGSSLVTRWQTSWIKHQENPVSLSDADTSISAASLLPGLLVGPSGSLTANRILTLDTAANIISNFGTAKDGDAIDFTVINTSSASDFNYTLAMDVSGTMVGDNTIYPTVNSVTGGSGTYNASNSTLFRLVVSVTNTTYTVYRIA